MQEFFTLWLQDKEVMLWGILRVFIVINSVLFFFIPIVLSLFYLSYSDDMALYNKEYAKKQVSYIVCKFLLLACCVNSIMYFIAPSFELVNHYTKKAEQRMDIERDTLKK